MPIPTIRPTLLDREACLADFDAIWESGRLTTGPFTARLEAALGERLAVAHAVCVGSCTSGLMLVQRALGLSGEVIIPTFTWTATGTSLLWNNCTPVFVDARPGDLNIDPDQIERAITANIRAICPVAVFGTPTDCDRIVAIGEKHGIPVFFDSAQAIGAGYRGQPVGGFGAAEVFSLSPTKVVSAVEMGVVTTNDAGLAERLRQMRDYGKSAHDEDITALGLSVRPSEFHAVIGFHNLRHIDELIAHRGQMIALYRERLSGIPGIRFQIVPEDRTSSNNYMVILLDDDCALTRDELFRALGKESIASKRYFYPCLHNQTVFRNTATVSPASLPVAEDAAARALALPLYGHITADDVNRVIDVIARVCG